MCPNTRKLTALGVSPRNIKRLLTLSNILCIPAEVFAAQVLDGALDRLFVALPAESVLKLEHKFTETSEVGTSHEAG